MTTTSVSSQLNCAICDGPVVASSIPEYSKCTTCSYHAYIGSAEGGPVTNQAPIADVAGEPSSLQKSQTRVVRAVFNGGVNVVDIGCGDGGFLAALQQSDGPAFNELFGVEVDPDSVRHARGVRGLQVLDRLTDLGSELSLATAWHSAEHFPIEVLRNDLTYLAESLGPNGRLLVSVPNGASLQQRCFKQRWAFHDNPNHRSIFTPTSLDALLSSSGFERVAAVRIPRYGFFAAVQSSFNMFVRPRNALYLALKRGTFRLNRRHLVWHALVSPVVGLVSLPFLVAELNWRRAASLNVWYRPSTSGTMPKSPASPRLDAD